MAIHRVKNVFVISSHRVWMPGAYDTEKTARYAFQFKDEELNKMQRIANKRNGGFDGVITMDDLKKIFRERS